MHLHKAPVPKAGGHAALSQTAAAGVLQHNEQRPGDESPPPSLPLSHHSPQPLSRGRITAGSLGGESAQKTRIGSQSAGPRSSSGERSAGGGVRAGGRRLQLCSCFAVQSAHVARVTKRDATRQQKHFKETRRHGKYGQNGFQQRAGPCREAVQPLLWFFGSFGTFAAL